MSENAYIEIAYKDNGRVVEGPCSGVVKYVICGLAKPRTTADTEKLQAWFNDLDDEGRESILVAAERVRPKVQWDRRPDGDDEADDEGVDAEDAEADVDDGESGEAEEAKGGDDEGVEASDEDTGTEQAEGWPEGVTFVKRSSYYEVFGSDGEWIKSETKSGKFNGEDAAQEAAWKYKAALKRGE